MFLPHTDTYCFTYKYALTTAHLACETAHQKKVQKASSVASSRKEHLYSEDWPKNENEKKNIKMN